MMKALFTLLLVLWSTNASVVQGAQDEAQGSQPTPEQTQSGAEESQEQQQQQGQRLFFPLPYDDDSCPRFNYDAIYDLEGWSIKPSPYVELVEGIFSYPYGVRCKSRGVLKIKLADAATDPSRRRALVDMFFDGTPLGIPFDLGDSSTNDGNGGDAGTQANDAEARGMGSYLVAYYNQYYGNSNALYKSNIYSKRLTLIAADGQLHWLSDKPETDSFNFKAHPGLYALNGQGDQFGPINFDLYLGMNKPVKKGGSTFGLGLCKVGIKFLPEY